MPALGYTVDLDTIAADYQTMDSGEFARAYLNRWSPKCGPVFELAQWLACLDPLSTTTGTIGFGIDVAPDRSSATIAAAGGRGRAGATSKSWTGHGWDWTDRWSSCAAGARVGIDPAAPASNCCLLSTLAGYRWRSPAGPTGRRVGRSATTWHRPDRPAVKPPGRCRGRNSWPLGDAWAWARTPDPADPAPLIAATLARWAWTTARPIGVQVF
jgi:hypothetical protein